MLVEFKFGNFRSFKDEAYFSMEPLTQNGKNINVINTNVKKIPQLYTTAGFFGPNASGKSNILKAFYIFRRLIKETFSYEVDKTLKTDPYLLNEEYAKKPTFFEISFLVEDNLYKYGFQYGKTKIFEEYLYITDFSSEGTARERRIFHRKENELLKSKGILQRWIDDLSSNRLFLSDIINNRKCELPEIVAAYTWMMKKIHIISNSVSQSFSFDMIQKGDKAEIIEHMKNADLGLESISVNKIELEDLLKIADKKEATDELKKVFQDVLMQKLKNGDAEAIDVKTFHKTENETLKEFKFEEAESKGTKVFLALTGPIIDTLRDGSVLAVDELDASLHPMLIKYLISLFNNPEINKNNAQLIFTSHAHYLMDGEYLTRDQIWFTAKENGLSSELYSIADFNEDRRKKSFYESYMHGIYGAVPKVKGI
ncbi:MAG: ATP-binding protein [Proteobacteria bacterium]|nr:ATP-binding protein [Pseudomonadota bacterium]